MGAVNKRESRSGTWRPPLAPGKALLGGSFSCRLRTLAAEEDDDGVASARVALKLPSLTALLWLPALVGLLIGCPTSTTIGFTAASSSTLRLADHRIRHRLLVLLHHAAAFSFLPLSLLLLLQATRYQVLGITVLDNMYQPAAGTRY
uniref:Uncharacterized protein n=1 Tax=Oryza rufipogon TaxID=4529 RepID=A0A0E0NK43_ORYRU